MTQRFNYDYQANFQEGRGGTIFQRNLDKVTTRDILLRIASICPSFSILDVIRDQKDAKKILS